MNMTNGVSHASGGPKFRPTTEAVPDADYVDQFAELEISKLVFHNDCGTYIPNVGNLWGGISEFTELADNPKIHKKCMEGHPDFSRFARPLTFHEAASRFQNIRDSRASSGKADDTELAMLDRVARAYLEDSYLEDRRGG